MLAQLTVHRAQLADQAIVVALEPERLHERLDDLQQVLQLPRLRDHVVQVAGVDRRDQIVGFGIAGDDGAPAVRTDLRDAREPGWERGLRSSAHVITDALTARQLPDGLHPRVYRVVADSSLAELRAFVERFLTGGGQ